MRILHIIGTLDPAAGGPSALVRTTSANAPPGISFEAVTEDSPDAEFLSEIGIPIHAFGSPAKRWFTPGMLAWLRQNRSRFDGVIVHGLWEYCCLAARLAFAGNTPMLVFPHGMLDPYFARAHKARHFRKQLYWWLVTFWNLRSAKRVLFTTVEEARLAKRTFFPTRWRAAITPLGCEAAPPDTTALRDRFVQRTPHLQPGDRFFLFLGRIDPKKGCGMLVKAFLSLAERWPDLHLVMAGPGAGAHSARLQQLAMNGSAAGRVHFPGMLLGDETWAALAACDAFVLPSHQENFGIAVIEALASGKPVLLSDKVNTAAEIAAAGAGLVEPDTCAGTVALLTRWLTLDAASQAAMSGNARMLYERRFTIRRNTAAMLTWFEPDALPATGTRS